MPTQIVKPETFTAAMPNAIYSEPTLDGMIEGTKQQPQGLGSVTQAQNVGLNLRTLARTIKVSAEEYRDLASDLQSAIGWQLVFGSNRKRAADYEKIVELMHGLDQHAERYVSARRLLLFLLHGPSTAKWLQDEAATPKFDPVTGRLEQSGRESDLSTSKRRYIGYPPVKRGKWGPEPLTADDYDSFVSIASKRIWNLLGVIESATDRESIKGILERRDFLEDRMNASYWAFVGAEWEAKQITGLYQHFLYAKAREDWKDGREVDTFLTFLKLPREQNTLLKTMRAASISLPTRTLQAYRDVQLHHSTGLYIAGMIGIGTSTVGAAAGLLPPVGDISPPLANIEPLKFLGGYFWSLVTGIGMYGLTSAGPWTAGKLRSRGRYVLV